MEAVRLNEGRKPDPSKPEHERAQTTMPAESELSKRFGLDAI